MEPGAPQFDRTQDLDALALSRDRDFRRLADAVWYRGLTIGLARRDGTVPNQLFDGIGQMLERSQQLASEIEALGFWGIADAAHMSSA